MPLDGEFDRNRNVADVRQSQIAEAYVERESAPRTFLVRDRREQVAEGLGCRIGGNAQRPRQSYLGHPSSVF